MFAGRFAPSRSHLEEALALYDPISHRSLVHQAGISSPGRITGGFWGLSFSVSVIPTRHWHGATRQSPEARRLAHPPSLAVSLALGARLRFARRRQRSPRRAGRPAGCGGDRARFRLAARDGNDLSRVGQGQEWRCDGGHIAPAQRFGRLPRHRRGAMDAPSYRPPGQGM